MNLGAFMDPEFPIFSTTLCYLEREDAYLMLHRIKKQDDYNHDKWVGVGGKFERFESPEDCLVRLRQARLPGAVFQRHRRCALHEETAGRKPGHRLHPAR